MPDPETLINHTIDALEGGFVHHPADKGGPTNRGITQRVYAEHLGRPVTVDEVRRMPRAHAVAIHRDRYWDRPKLHLLPDALQPVAFDMAVNHGARAAVRLIQRTLGDLHRPVTVDGVVGPITAMTAAVLIVDHGAAELVNAVCDRRQRLYDAIIRRDPSQAVFAAGWKRRCDHFRLPT